jgi:Ion channel
VSALQALELAAGVLVVAAIYYDLFQSVVLPRPAVGKLRLAPYIIRPLWRGWRWVGTRTSRIDKREQRLAIFGPVAQFILLGFWYLFLILGFGLILDALPSQIQPAPTNFGTSFYFSGTTLLPLSYGEFVPVGVPARLVVLAESASGVLLIALVVSLLFSLYGSFQQREQLVVSLDALAGAPPSGVQILENAAKHGLRDELTQTFDDWRRWSAAVLETHLAYPILVYFRSSHDNEAWLNSFGAVMDAATLVMSTVEDVADGPARLMSKVGGHLIEDFSWFFRIRGSPDSIVEREEFDQAHARLVRAGYRCRAAAEAWPEFARLRSTYASPLNQLAQFLAILPAQWIGDRTYLPHVRGGRTGRRRLVR